MGCFRAQKNTENPMPGAAPPSGPLAEGLCPAISGKLSEQEEVSAQEHLFLCGWLESR